VTMIVRHRRSPAARPTGQRSQKYKEGPRNRLASRSKAGGAHHLTLRMPCLVTLLSFRPWRVQPRIVRKHISRV
jgi:hypothetical protein